MDTPTTACVHHWVLGSPRDDVTVGHCKTCGEERTFSNARQPMRLRTRATPPAKSG